jgi:hypothetical protein
MKHSNSNSGNVMLALCTHHETFTPGTPSVMAAIAPSHL